MAERILEFYGNLSKRVFLTVLISSLIAVCFSFAIETSAIWAGIWKWMPESARYRPRFYIGFSSLLIPIDAFSGWHLTTMIFLSTFFLMECTKYRKSRFKYLILLSIIFHYQIIPYLMWPIFKNPISIFTFLVFAYTLISIFLVIFRELDFDY